MHGRKYKFTSKDLVFHHIFEHEDKDTLEAQVETMRKALEELHKTSFKASWIHLCYASL